MKKLCVFISLCTFLFAYPVFSGMQFDGRTICNDDYVESKPLVSVGVTGADLDFNRFELFIDGVSVLVTGSAANYTYSAGALHFKVPNELNNGVHTFQAKAYDRLDFIQSTSLLQSVFVGVDSIKIDNPPIVYPSPATSSARICYELSRGTDVEFCIYSIQGQLVYHDRIAKGLEGAHAGYNEYVYDLRYADGRLLPGGIFYLMLLDRSGEKTSVLGKRKFMVVRDEQ